MSESKNTLDENMIGWGIMAAFVGCLIWFFWIYNHTEVRNVVRWVRYAEMWMMSWFVPDDYTFIFKEEPVNWKTAFEQIPLFNKAELQYVHLSYIHAMTMYPLRPLFAFLAGVMALWSLFLGPKTQYRKTLGLNDLIARQSKNFPVISPFVDFNPNNQPPRPPGAPVPAELPAFAEALGLEEWLVYHRIPIKDNRVDQAATAKALRRQLGPRWRGVKALKPHEQIMMAAFCLKASRKRDQADALLGRLARCWTFKDGLNLGKDKKLLKEARDVLRNKDLAKLTVSNANRHAYVTTALLRALATARDEGGVLAPAQFVWLRAHDRDLWYPLNNLGRQSFHMEALGAMSHYAAEKMTNRPIPVPKLERAMETVTEYTASRRMRPLPNLDYSGTEKRAIKKAK